MSPACPACANLRVTLDRLILVVQHEEVIHPLHCRDDQVRVDVVRDVLMPLFAAFMSIDRPAAVRPAPPTWLSPSCTGD